MRINVISHQESKFDFSFFGSTEGIFLTLAQIQINTHSTQKYSYNFIHITQESTSFVNKQKINLHETTIIRNFDYGSNSI